MGRQATIVQVAGFKVLRRRLSGQMAKGRETCWVSRTINTTTFYSVPCLRAPTTPSSAAHQLYIEHQPKHPLPHYTSKPPIPRRLPPDQPYTTNNAPPTLSVPQRAIPPPAERVIPHPDRLPLPFWPLRCWQPLPQLPTQDTRPTGFATPVRIRPWCERYQDSVGFLGYI